MSGPRICCLMKPLVIFLVIIWRWMVIIPSVISRELCLCSLRDVEQKLLLNYLAVIPPMEIIGLGMFVGLDFWIQICRSEARFPAAWCWYNADDARIAPTSWLTPLVMMARSGPLFRSLCWATAHQLSCVPVFDFWVKKQTSKIKQLFLISFLCGLKCAR